MTRRQSLLGAIVLVGIALSTITAGVAMSASDDRGLVIRNARLIDGTGAAPRDHVTILVRDGRIVAIGDDVPASDVQAIDGSGVSVLPGLIDAHVHFLAATGSDYRKDSDETIRALNRQHLRAYLACGVTTVLDAGAFVEVVRDIQGWLRAGNPGPRYLTTGPYIRPPAGYGNDRFGAEATPADVEAKLDLLQSLDAAGVKIAFEDGLGPLSDLAQFSPEMLQAIVAGAARRHLPVYVHALNEKADNRALDLGARAIMHAAQDIPLFGSYFASPDLSDAFIARMARSGAYQVSTLSVFDTWPTLYDPARLDDPLTRLVVPKVEMETALAAGGPDRFAVSFIGWVAPWTFEVTRRLVGRYLLTKDHLSMGLRQGQRNVARLHQAGVPIVVGTDVPSPWPHALYHFHGVQTAREVELLVEAGLSPRDAIVAATRNPAAMLGLDRELGTVEVGKRADLLVVRGDPTRDIRALHEVAWTVFGGRARTPEEWMTE